MDAGDQPVRSDLAGRRVLITRDPERTRELIALLQERGAEVLAFPAIRIEPLGSAELDTSLRALHRFDYILFTSRNAVDIVLRRMEELGIDPSTAFNNRVVAAVGEATKASLQRRAVRDVIVGKRASAAGLLDALPGDLEGHRIFLPGSRISRPELADGLRRRGADVIEVAVYDTLPPRCMPDTILEAVQRGTIDVVFFASPSAVHNMISVAGSEEIRASQIVCIGPTTAGAVREYGLQVAAEASKPAPGAVVEAITRAALQPREEADT
ncbi:MAG: uroporphyrinogen-III synthase [Chloroflexota bacterium]